MNQKLLCLASVIFLNNLSFGVNFNLQFPAFHKNDKFYVSWGYNRDFYSTSNLHFRMGLKDEYQSKSNYINFIAYNAKATDRPDFDKIKNVIEPSIPQFNCRLGVISNTTGFGFEIAYDHAKYVVNDFQNLRVKGNIFGRQIDSVLQINPYQFFHLEHTDGANFFKLNVTKSNMILKISKKISLTNMFKFGAGIVIPRTDVSFMGIRHNNNFHIAGYVLGIENGFQGRFGKHFFTELSAKYAFAYFTNAIIDVNQNTYVTHHFRTLMLFGNIGYSFQLN